MIRELSRAYSCRLGGPVLRAVDTAIFTARYFTHCMDCGFCGDSCCRFGVDIDLENVARLKAAPPAFKALVGFAEDHWFTSEVIRDVEFPGGAHVRTQVVEGACVFRNRAGRGCLIHAFCLQAGRDYHDLKPMVSILFPLTFELGVLELSGELQDRSLACTGEGPTAFEGVRGELAWYFGADLAAELDALSGFANLP